MDNKKKTTLLLFLAVVSLFGAQVELSGNDCSTLGELPITPEQRDAICERMRFGGGFNSIYDLLELGVFTPKEFAKLKPLVSIGAELGETSALDRIDSLYFRVGEWLAGESVSDEVVDMWVDAIRTMPTLLELDYRDLVSLQNVSSTDAIALLRHRRDIGEVKDRRQLRSVNGLSARGYVSVRTYIGYGKQRPIDWLTGGYAQARFAGTSDQINPLSYLKIRLNNGPISEGFRFGRSEGENIDHNNWANPFDYPDMKFYGGLTRYQLGPVKVRSFVIGDYSAAFGEGVTFNSGDYFVPRWTGTGFDVRHLGVYPDLSSSETYALRGTALELKWKSIEPTILVSSRNKDAILNEDGSFTDLISGAKDWENQVHETMFAGDLTFSPLLNLRIGVTGYRANYDKTWDPQPGSIINPDYIPGGTSVKVDERDAELFSMTFPQDNRSAVGIHGLWTIGNLALSAEFSEIVRDSNIALNWYENGIIDTISGEKTSFLPIGDDPYGLVAKAHFTSNRLSAVAVYRHYDLDFDNPYNRGFAEYARYKGSLIEDDYRLVDPNMVVLAEENPRPMAEEGLYLELYGKPFRQIDGTLEFDAFTRLSDMTDYRRIVLKTNWRPNNNLTFRLWRKWQGRSEENSLTPTAFTVDEIRLTADTRLANYSRLGFTLIHSFLGSPPRPRYYGSGDPLGEDLLLGGVVNVSEGLMLNYDINLSDHLAINGQAIVYRGWLWNFEDNEFSELDSPIDALHWWVAFRDRLVENLSLTFKIALDAPLEASNIDFRSGYGDPESEIEGTRVKEVTSSWRIQMDYFF
ncbi:hypothetical protein KAH81_06145 [bacterium]|nr:hypothetical protein [bacterium]